jgi:hypothetical protein
LALSAFFAFALALLALASDLCRQQCEIMIRLAPDASF